MTTTAVRAKIANGPSKFDLMLALFDRKVVNTRHVEFKMEGEGKIAAHVVIFEVRVEDGSGESWLFKGRVRGMEPDSHVGVPPVSRGVHGWYRTDTRKGWIELDD
ncbi:MAG: hypothetical protein ACREGR_03180 [Minisyncoccia bacterium]